MIKPVSTFRCKSHKLILSALIKDNISREDVIIIHGFNYSELFKYIIILVRACVRVCNKSHQNLT